jgi:hypothetical protein
MKPECVFLFSQELFFGSRPEPNELIPHSPTLFTQHHLNICLPFMRRPLTSGFLTTILYAFLTSPMHREVHIVDLNTLPSNIWRKVRIMRPFVQFCPASYYSHLDPKFRRYVSQNKIEKVYCLEYTSLPKKFFTPQHVGSFLH